MRRRLLALSLPVLALFAVAARKPDHPKHENHYKGIEVAAPDGLAVTLNSAESQVEFLKLDVKLTNTTQDRLLVVAKTGSEFVLPSGTAQVKAPLLFGNPLFILPGQSKSHAWMAEGVGPFHVDAFSFNPKGFLSAPNTGTVLEAPEFQISPSRNDFTVGSFACTLTDLNHKTDLSAATFTCVYNGTGVGYIDARSVGARSKSGVEYASSAKYTKRDVLLPGDKGKFATRIAIPASDADMQFVPYDLLFRDTFSEAETTPVTLPTWSFEVDAALTAANN